MAIDREAQIRIQMAMAGSEAASALEKLLERMEKIERGLDSVSKKILQPHTFDKHIPKAQMVADDHLLASQDRLTSSITDLSRKIDKLGGLFSSFSSGSFSSKAADTAFAAGVIRGRAQHKGSGGYVQHLYGTGGDDEPVYAHPGERVIPVNVAKRNRRALDYMMAGGQYSGGGIVPQLDLGGGYTLRNRWAEHDDVDPDWVLYSNAGGSEAYAGSFMMTRHKKGMANTNIGVTKEHRGKGLGRRAMRALAEVYGAVYSDPHGGTSDDARRMWESLGADRIPMTARDAHMNDPIDFYYRLLGNRDFAHGGIIPHFGRGGIKGSAKESMQRWLRNTLYEPESSADYEGGPSKDVLAMSDAIDSMVPHGDPMTLLGRDLWPAIPVLRELYGRNAKYFSWSRIQEGWETQHWARSGQRRTSYDTTKIWNREAHPHSWIFDTGYAGSIFDMIREKDPLIMKNRMALFARSANSEYQQIPIDYANVSSGSRETMVDRVEDILKIMPRSVSYSKYGNIIYNRNKFSTDSGTPGEFSRSMLQDNFQLLKDLGLSSKLAEKYMTFTGSTPQERLGLPKEGLQKHYDWAYGMRRRMMPHIYAAKGGIIPHHQHGGYVQRVHSTGGIDQELIWATPGERIIPPDIARKNKPALDEMTGNDGTPQGGRHYALGGLIETSNERRQRHQQELRELQIQGMEMQRQQLQNRQMLLQAQAAAPWPGPVGRSVYMAERHDLAREQLEQRQAFGLQSGDVHARLARENQGALTMTSAMYGVTAALGLLKGGLEASTNYMNVFNSTLTTSAQKHRQFFESAPLLGSVSRTLHHFQDARSGVLNRVQMADTLLGVRLGRQQAEQDMLSAADPLAQRRSALQAEAFGMGQFRLAPATIYNQMTETGRTRTQEQAIRLAAQDRLVQAQRAAAESAEAVRLQERDMGTTRVNQLILDREAQGADQYVRGLRTAENETGVRNQAGIQEAVNNAIARGNEAQLNRVRLVSQEGELQRRIMTNQERQNQLAMTRLEVERAEVQVLQMREGRMSFQAQAIGGMQRGERIAGRTAAQLIRDRIEEGGDIDLFHPGMVAQATPWLGPEWIRIQQEISGQRALQEEARTGGGALGGLSREDWEGGLGDLGAVRQRIVSIPEAIRQESDAVARQSAERMARAFASSIERFFGLFEDRFQQELMLLYQRLVQQNNAPGGVV